MFLCGVGKLHFDNVYKVHIKHLSLDQEEKAIGFFNVVAPKYMPRDFEATQTLGLLDL